MSAISEAVAWVIASICEAFSATAESKGSKKAKDAKNKEEAAKNQ